MRKNKGLRSMKSDQWIKELYDENYEWLFRLASNRLRAFVGHSSDAQDVVQEVFMLAAEKDIRNHPNPAGWLAVTAENTCKNYIRANARNERKQRKCAQAKFGKTAHPSLFLLDSVEDETRASDMRMTIERALPPEDWELLRKYCLEERSIEEIAEEIGMTPNALRVRIHRIRKRLKKYLE